MTLPSGSANVREVGSTCRLGYLSPAVAVPHSAAEQGIVTVASSCSAVAALGVLCLIARPRRHAFAAARLNSAR